MACPGRLEALWRVGAWAMQLGGALGLYADGGIYYCAAGSGVSSRQGYIICGKLDMHIYI